MPRQARSFCETGADPQNLSRQSETLIEAGVHVFWGDARAKDFCREDLKSQQEAGMPDLIDELLHGPLVVVHAGLSGYPERSEAQGVDVVQVDWVPPAGGTAR